MTVVRLARGDYLVVTKLADTLMAMTDELTPTRRWQALVPELRSFTLDGQASDAPMTEAEKARPGLSTPPSGCC